MSLLSSVLTLTNILHPGLTKFQQMFMNAICSTLSCFLTRGYCLLIKKEIKKELIKKENA